MTPADARTAASVQEGRTSVTIWGAGSVSELGEVCAKAGMTRVMAVAARSADGVAGQLPALLGERYLGRWSDVPPHVPAHQANLAVGSAQETHADGVVAIGGGAAIGLAKIVALALRLPLIAVPTTYSGSEMTSRYLVTTERGAETGASPRALATAVIYDPDLLAPMAHRIAATGVTAVAHCLEALCYPDVCDAVRGQAREGLLLLWDSLGEVAAVNGGQEVNVELRDFRRAFAALPATQREALTLIVASGFSYEEAAEIAGCPVGTMKSRVSRARAELESQLHGVEMPEKWARLGLKPDEDRPKRVVK